MKKFGNANLLSKLVHAFSVDGSTLPSMQEVVEFVVFDIFLV